MFCAISNLPEFVFCVCTKTRVDLWSFRGNWCFDIRSLLGDSLFESALVQKPQRCHTIGGSDQRRLFIVAAMASPTKSLVLNEVRLPGDHYTTYKYQDCFTQPYNHKKVLYSVNLGTDF